MDFLGFTLSVWSSILIGAFFLAMVFACTADRHDKEAPKWIILLVGLAAVGFWQWQNLSWAYFLSAPFWKTVGIYVGIGLAYSMVEFFFQVRREARRWAAQWQDFKEQYQPEATRPSPNAQRGQAWDSDRREADPPLAQRFIAKTQNSYGGSDRLVRVELDSNGAISPTVNKKELTECIGCWTLFWPTYAVSLVLGDVLTEICRRAADVFVFISSGFVRRAFAKVFR